MKKIFLIFLIIFLSLPAIMISAAEPVTYKWVLAETKVNPSNEPTSFVGGGALDWYYPEERYLGKTRDYLVSETSISMKDHEFDNGEFWNVTFTANFTKPPTILIPGETVVLPVSVSGGGSVTNGGGGQSGILFEYRINGGTIAGSQQGIDLNFKSASGNPSFVVPTARAGGKLVINAFLWNCGACNVEWQYQAEAVVSDNTSEKVDAAPVVEEEALPAAETETVVEEKTVEEETALDPCLGEMTQEEIDKIRSMPGGVTIIEEARGNVEVYRDGKWTPAKAYMIIGPGEAIRTGEGSEVFFIVKKVLQAGDKPYVPMSIQEREMQEELMRNREVAEAGFSPEYVWGALKSITVFGQWDFDKYEPDRGYLEENSTVCTGEFYDSQEAGNIGLLEGAVQMFTNGWKNGTIFSVKAGTTVCGIRGSEVYIAFDPDINKTEAYVIEGHMDVTDIVSGESESLTNNEKVILQNNQLGEIEPMSQAEWDELAVDLGIDDEEVQAEAIPAELADSEDAKASEKEEPAAEPEAMNYNPLLFLLPIVVIIIIVFLSFRKKPEDK